MEGGIGELHLLVTCLSYRGVDVSSLAPFALPFALLRGACRPAFVNQIMARFKLIKTGLVAVCLQYSLHGMICLTRQLVDTGVRSIIFESHRDSWVTKYAQSSHTVGNRRSDPEGWNQGIEVFNTFKPFLTFWQGVTG